eukprot:scaffold1020_cov388-Prasinococcus_capsulatus_cf.AAC.1
MFVRGVLLRRAGQGFLCYCYELQLVTVELGVDMDLRVAPSTRLGDKRPAARRVGRTGEKLAPCERESLEASTMQM